MGTSCFSQNLKVDDFVEIMAACMHKLIVLLTKSNAGGEFQQIIDVNKCRDICLECISAVNDGDGVISAPMWRDVAASIPIGLLGKSQADESNRPTPRIR